MGVAERVGGADRDDRDSGLDDETGVFASVVWDLQYIDGPRNGNRSFQVARQEDCCSINTQLQDNGVVVLDATHRSPVTWRMQDGERADLLACPDPSDGDLALVDLFEQVLILGDHRIPAEPDLADFEVSEDIQQAIDVVLVGMGQDERVEPPNAPLE